VRFVGLAGESRNNDANTPLFHVQGVPPMKLTAGQIEPAAPPAAKRLDSPGAWVFAGVLGFIAAYALYGSFDFAIEIRRWPLGLSVVILVCLAIYAVQQALLARADQQDPSLRDLDRPQLGDIGRHQGPVAAHHHERCRDAGLREQLATTLRRAYAATAEGPLVSSGVVITALSDTTATSSRLRASRSISVRCGATGCSVRATAAGCTCRARSRSERSWPSSAT
jgi:hypothetical protein